MNIVKGAKNQRNMEKQNFYGDFWYCFYRGLEEGSPNSLLVVQEDVRYYKSCGFDDHGRFSILVTLNEEEIEKFNI